VCSWGIVRFRSSSRIWAVAIVCLVAAQIVVSVLLPKSFLLTAVTDSIALVLMLSAAAAFALNAFSGERGVNLVWLLLGSGYLIEAGSQLLWMYWELIRREAPKMSLGDAGIFLAWTALILGFAMRPHVEPTKQRQRLGILDLLILLLTGVYLYAFLVIPWQYLSPEPHAYQSAYKFLALAQDVIFLSIVTLGWRRSTGRWQQFYGLLTAIVAMDTVMEYVVDTLSETGVYFSGGWYDTTTAIGIAAMTIAPLMVRGLEPVPEHDDPPSERYWLWASRLAAPATLFLPLLATWSFLDHSLPSSVWNFRVVLSLGSVLVFGFIAIVKQTSLERELAGANRELLEASLTDLLTGVRNRRFFSTTIEADIQHVMRSFGQNSGAGAHNRDLVFYLIDIDLFKKVNDELGHQAGDRILVEVARRISTAARLSDAVVRWGGEEFLLISRFTDRTEAHVLAARVLEAVGSMPYEVEGNATSLPITCSLGWAAFPWFAADPRLVPYDKVLALADHALYQAKDAGRNRAVGFLSPGEAVRDIAVGPAIQVDGLRAATVAILGPPQSRAEAASAH